MADDDVSLTPSGSADSPAAIEVAIDQDIREMYDVYSYRHAATILKNSYPDLLNEIQGVLRDFSFTTVDIGMPGGNESLIPKKLSSSFRPLDWHETRIQGDLIVRVAEQTEDFQADGSKAKKTLEEKEPVILENYIDGHKIDYVKGQVALDMEWNSKDQTYDRDLYAFRMFYECGVISAAVLITRSEKLNAVFNEVPRREKDGSVVYKDGEPHSVKSKYGASTTWMGKLIYRLNAGRHGGCPVLVFGITPAVIEDWPIT